MMRIYVFYYKAHRVLYVKIDSRLHVEFIYILSSVFKQNFRLLKHYVNERAE